MTETRHPRPQRCRRGQICGLPLGLTSRSGWRQFAADPDVVPDPPVVGFVGTFDPRKGMCEFPDLVDRVVRRIPGVTFRLLGTAGMVPDADGVRGYFPRWLWPRLEIYPRYDPNELPGLLAGVSVGVFPSRVESFGYGVLEMLAAAVPVIAYDAPGPHVMLPPEYRSRSARSGNWPTGCVTSCPTQTGFGKPAYGHATGWRRSTGAGGHGHRSGVPGASRLVDEGGRPPRMIVPATRGYSTTTRWFAITQSSHRLSGVNALR